MNKTRQQVQAALDRQTRQGPIFGPSAPNRPMAHPGTQAFNAARNPQASGTQSTPSRPSEPPKAPTGKQCTIFIPVKTSTPGNNRKHWAVSGREARAQREATRLMLGAAMAGGMLPPFPVRVIFMRVSNRKLDRHNLPGALKHVIDGVADVYRVDDGDDGWVFEFDQRKPTAKDRCLYGVGIEIREV